MTINIKMTNDNTIPQTEALDILMEIERSRHFMHETEYYSLFNRLNMDLEDAIELLVTTDTQASAYVLVQIFGNPDIINRFKWQKPTMANLDVYEHLKDQYAYLRRLYLKFPTIIAKGIFHLKGFWVGSVKDLTLVQFKISTEAYFAKGRKMYRAYRAAEEALGEYLGPGTGTQRTTAIKPRPKKKKQPSRPARRPRRNNPKPSFDDMLCDW